MKTKPKRQKRRAQVRAIVADAGEHGATWREVAAALGLDHGSASGALAALQNNGEIVRLRRTRDRCGVYVLSGYAELSDVAPRRRAAVAADTLIDIRKDGFDAGWQAGYDEALLTSAEQAGELRRDGIQRFQGELLRIAGAMIRAADPNGITVTHSHACWQNHPACAIRAMTKAIAEPRNVLAASQVPSKWYNNTGGRTKVRGELSEEARVVPEDVA